MEDYVDWLECRVGGTGTVVSVGENQEGGFDGLVCGSQRLRGAQCSAGHGGGFHVATEAQAGGSGRSMFEDGFWRKDSGMKCRRSSRRVSNLPDASVYFWGGQKCLDSVIPRLDCSLRYP